MKYSNTFYVDSSEDEELWTTPNTEIIKKIQTYQAETDIDNFKIYLSLLLQYLADRFLNQSLVNAKYQEFKQTLSLNSNEVEQFKKGMSPYKSSNFVQEDLKKIFNESIFPPDIAKKDIAKKEKLNSSNFIFLQKSKNSET